MNPQDPRQTPPEVLEARRRAAIETLGRGVLVLPAAPVQYASRDEERPYHPDRDLYYLTGATEPGTVAVLIGGDDARLALFVRERDPEAELWAGSRLGTEGAVDRFRPDECHPLGQIEERLPEFLRQGDRIFFRLGRGDAVERSVLAAVAHARLRGARAGHGPSAVVDPGEVLDDLRLVKDDHEMALLRRAVEISVDGHCSGARAISPGTGEWVIQAAIDGTFRASGAEGPGYETIVGSGPNACILHYVKNERLIGPDELVLVDAGAQFGLYHGDVTRTYPATGYFTGLRRDVYEIVEAARSAAVASVSPGVPIAVVHDAATRVLVEGLVELGALSGDADALVGEGAFKPFYPHQTSHWLGLDVHDPGNYARDGASRPLEPGMVLTVEPGLYFRPDHPATDERFAGIGVRIEDDVVVTANGREVLSSGLPTAIADVEALVQAAR